MVARFCGFDGRHVYQQAVGLHCRSGSQFKKHMADHGTIVQQGDYYICVAHRFGRSAVHRGTLLGQTLRFVGGAVPYLHIESGFTQPAPHGKTHQPDSQYCYFHRVYVLKR
jgi:hypothetical protein